MAVETQEMAGLRLLRGRDCWWCLSGKRVARLPLNAVADDGLLVQAHEALRGRGFFEDPPSSVYAVTVLTATDCNLGCFYCFQNTGAPKPGSFAPPRIARATLGTETVARIEQFLRRRMAELDYRELSLLLFGGEPLLNPRGCIDVLTALAPLGLVRGEIITNGVLLTPELARELEHVGLRHAQITLDGNRDAHDTIRTTRSGRGTFDRIVANVKAATAATSIEWHFRVNVSHRNLETLGELLLVLGEAVPTGRASLHIALIDDTGLNYENHVGYDDCYAATLVRLHRLAMSLGLSVAPSQPLSDCRYCGIIGGRIGAVINADGVLYSCWESAGRPGWEVGTVNDGYHPDEVIRDRWVSCAFDAKPHAAPERTKRFFDQVDAALLDDLYETGVLASPAARAGSAATC